MPEMDLKQPEFSYSVCGSLRQVRNHTKNILISHIRYVTPSSVKPLHLVINNAHVYLEESNGNKYLTLVPTDESRGMLRK